MTKSNENQTTCSFDYKQEREGKLAKVGNTSGRSFLIENYNEIYVPKIFIVWYWPA